ncbi:hypothetical protein EVAR_3563_1 [Eumeta japonica]|uniref:Uncharacterized protein n=1 Tax=Eumeta variegata TaxID=151549 RepID=A0A4C1SVE5_EUMVA|nr:hypothetical protein EVAR_3563_1 [Eumeta japonica]
MDAASRRVIKIPVRAFRKRSDKGVMTDCCKTPTGKVTRIGHCLETANTVDSRQAKHSSKRAKCVRKRSDTRPVRVAYKGSDPDERLKIEDDHRKIED